MSQGSVTLKAHEFNAAQNIFCEVRLARAWDKYHIPDVTLKTGLSKTS